MVRTLVKLTLFRQFYIMVRGGSGCGWFGLTVLGVHVVVCVWRAPVKTAVSSKTRPASAMRTSSQPCCQTAPPPARPVGPPNRTAKQRPVPRRVPPQVVCYIYFTRIIVYLLESTLPYQYIWMAAAASELATLSFYIASGISFRWVGRGMCGCVGGVCMWLVVVVVVVVVWVCGGRWFSRVGHTKHPCCSCRWL